MKIVLLSNLFPNPIEPVRGMFNLHIAKHLASHGHAVTVVSPLPYFPAIRSFRRIEQWYKFSQVPAEAVFGSVRVFYPKYPMIPKAEAAQSFLMAPFLYRTIRGIQLNDGIDIVNAHYLYPDGVAACRVCTILKIPLVLSALGSDVNVLAQKKGISQQIQHALTRSNAITTVSADLGRKIQALGIDDQKIHVLPNGVDLSLFTVLEKKSERSRIGVPGDGKIILYVGRLSPEKGIDCLLKAARALKQQLPHPRVVLIGDGSDQKRLKALCETLAITDMVHFIGEQTPAEINQWLGAADVLCLPSIREGCPNVILEAFASGRPVVGSNVGGIPEMIDEGRNGFLFQSGDADNLVKTLNNSLRFPWDPAVIRKSVESKSWSTVSEKYISLYRQSMENFQTYS